MSSKSWQALWVALGCIVVAATSALAQSDEGSVVKRYEKNRIFVKNNSLIVGKGPYVLMRGKDDIEIQAIEAPGLAKPDFPHGDFVSTLARIGEVGGNSVCVDLPGLSADGTSMAPEALASFRKTLDEANYRRMPPICRIFGADAPEDPAYRQAAVVTAANALKTYVDCLYWIDGPDAGALAEQFKKAAPRLCVAAPQNGDVAVVTEVPTVLNGPPLLLVGKIAMPENGNVNYVLPGTEETYKQFELANTQPMETAPWNPDNSVLSEQERQEGFIALFNGKDLSGWYTVGENKNGFIAKDGAIEWNEPGASLLRTRDRYENFVLRLEWKIAKGKNSGVQVHLPRASRGSKLGFEIQMLGYRNDPPTPDSTGAVYEVVAPKVDASKEPGEWNNLEVMINWPQLKVTLNGEVIHDFNMEENEELRYRLRKGFIGLTDHGGYVAFRNIRVKPL